MSKWRPEAPSRIFKFATICISTPLFPIGQILTTSDWFSLEKLCYDWLVIKASIGRTPLGIKYTILGMFNLLNS
jgi:hypothetical protein